MLKVSEVIVVEGRYDKNTLSQVVDATIIETGGFRIFSDPQKLALVKKLAVARGIIVMTDSDGAGFVIRNRIKSAVDPSLIKHAYIPDVSGKEKRKSRPSAEGKLGVEGMNPETIIKALKRAGATLSEGEPEKLITGEIKKADMFFLGLSGGANSEQRRTCLKKRLDLPERMSPKSLLDTLNVLMTRDELFSLAEKLEWIVK